MLRAQVQSLVRELRSYKLHVIAHHPPQKKKKKKQREKINKKIKKCRDFVRTSCVCVCVCVCVVPDPKQAFSVLSSPTSFIGECNTQICVIEIWIIEHLCFNL